MALSGSQIVSIVLGFFAVIRALFPEFGLSHVALSGQGVATNLYVWTIFTAGFYESFALLIFVDIALTFAVGRYLEASSWSTDDFLRYVFQSNLLVMASALVVSILGSFVTQYAPPIYSGSVSGFSGVLAAYSVVMWQKVGESPVVPQVGALAFLKFHHLPMVAVASSALVLVVDGDLARIMLTCFGIFYSWTYLRSFMTVLKLSRKKKKNEVANFNNDTAKFLKKNPELGGMLGDMREEFAFDAMFPAPVRPLVLVVSTVSLKTANALGFFRRDPLLPVSNPVRRDDNDDFRDYSTSTKLAEERRQLAIKAIDEKIAQIQSNMKKKSTSKLSQNPKKTDASSSLATQRSSRLDSHESDDEKEPLVKKVRRDAQA